MPVTAASTPVLFSPAEVRGAGAATSSAIGNGTTTASTVPVTVSGVSGAVSIAVGNVHTCAVVSDGTARCWGLNDRGKLGNGTTGGSSNTPVQVAGIP